MYAPHAINHAEAVCVCASGLRLKWISAQATRYADGESGHMFSALLRGMMEELPIRTQQLELIKLQFNLSQELLWLTIQPLLDASTPRVWVIILKSRRAGISTEIESIMVSLCALFDRLFGTVIAHDAPASENIWKMAHTMATQGGLSGVADEEGKEIRFGNSLLRMATAGSPQKTRSYDNTALHLSETAFWPKPGAMLAAKQTVPKQGMSFLFNES